MNLLRSNEQYYILQAISDDPQIPLILEADKVNEGRGGIINIKVYGVCGVRVLCVRCGQFLPHVLGASRNRRVS